MRAFVADLKLKFIRCDIQAFKQLCAGDYEGHCNSFSCVSSLGEAQEWLQYVVLYMEH